MKQFSLFLTIIIALVSLTGCEDGNVVILRREVNSTNALCPINLGIIGDLISIKYDENRNMVLMYYSLNEDMAGYVFLKRNKENVKKNLRLILSSEDSHVIVKDMVNAKASLMVIYKSLGSGKTLKYEISSDELKDIINHPLSDKEIQIMTLENGIVIENSSMPMKIDDGLTQTKVALVDDNIVYYIEVDEKLFDIKTMNKMSYELRDGIEEELKSIRKDPTGYRRLQLLTDLEKGYIYRFYGNESKNYFDVVILPYELFLLFTK